MKRLLSDIWDGIRMQPGRTGLSFLSIFIGMICLTVLLAVLGGLSEKSHRLIREMGVNVFALAAPPPSDAFLTNDLTEAHLALLAANLPDALVSGTRLFTADATGLEGPIAIVATDDKLPAVRRWRMLAGRFIDAMDIKHNERVAVVTRPLGAISGWDLGQVVSLKNEAFTIVGIVEPGDGISETDERDGTLSTGNRTLFIPLSAAREWLEPAHASIMKLDAIYVQVPESADMATIECSAQRVVSGPSEKPNRFSWITPDTLLRNVRKLQASIAFTAGSVALLCIILGGTTLMSLMVANVRDRITEIGLRRALGATPGNIGMLFITEACLVTGSASLAATTLTHLTLAALKNYLPTPVHTDAQTFVTPILVSLLLGIVFSYGPATTASRISPSEALRND